MIPRLKTEGYSADGIRVYPKGGGGGPTQSTVTNTNIPEYAKPYVETMLGATQQQLFNTSPNASGGTDITGIKPYQPYSENPTDYVAGFSPLQQQSFKGAQELGVQPQIGQGSNLATAAGIGALNTQYGGQQFGNTYQGFPTYNPGRFNQQRVGVEQFTGDQVGQYMNPYLQQSLAPQLQEIQRQYGITGTQQQGAATQAGAFGGSREAIMAAENERNKNTAMNQIIGQGYNTAFNNAQNQFNQAQQQGLQAQQANQQTNLATQQAQQQARQFGYGQLANQAQNYAQYGQAANQLNAQQQQFGANLGLQGLQTGLQAAGQLGQLGQAQFGQEQGAIGLQNQMGAQQQAQQQGIINQGIQNYATAQQYPQQQLAFMNSMLRGLPLQTQTVQGYQAAPSGISQLAGLGTAGIAGLGLYNTMNRGATP